MSDAFLSKILLLSHSITWCYLICTEQTSLTLVQVTAYQNYSSDLYCHHLKLLNQPSRSTWFSAESSSQRNLAETCLPCLKQFYWRNLLRHWNNWKLYNYANRILRVEVIAWYTFIFSQLFLYRIIFERAAIAERSYKWLGHTVIHKCSTKMRHTLWAIHRTCFLMVENAI